MFLFCSHFDSYLIQDGGNVVISDIDGPVVRLELQVGSYLQDKHF